MVMTLSIIVERPPWKDLQMKKGRRWRDKSQKAENDRNRKKKNRGTREDMNREIKEPETRREGAERQEMGAGEERELPYTELTNILQSISSLFPCIFQKEHRSPASMV